jgi:hypothetical protein
MGLSPHCGRRSGVMASECSFGEDHCGVVIELEADYARLEEALRECVHQIECVKEYYPIYPVDLPKLDCALRQAREVLGDA